MVRYPEHLVKQARRLVAGGMSCAQVGRTLNVHNAIISGWCRDVAKSRFLGLVNYYEGIRRNLLESEKGVVEDLVGKEKARFICGLLYGCEGAKYPASNSVSLVNSDPLFVSSFVKLMRRAFSLDESKWRVHLQIHKDQDYQILRTYWSRLLKIPEGKFFKPTITNPRGRKHRNIYLGNCSVRYGDYRLQLKLIGIFDEFLRKCGDLEGGQDGNARGC